MTAIASPPAPPTPGPLTLAAARLGRILGVNVRLAQRGDELAIVLDNDAVVLTSSATKEGAVVNATAFLNKIAGAVEHRFKPSPAANPVLSTPVPERKAPVGPSTRRIG